MILEFNQDMYLLYSIQTTFFLFFLFFLQMQKVVFIGWYQTSAQVFLPANTTYASTELTKPNYDLNENNFKIG